MATDREILKLAQQGALTTQPLAGPAANAIAEAHTTTAIWQRTTTDNADLNVTGQPMMRVGFKSRAHGASGGIWFTPLGTTAGNATHYTLLTVEKTNSSGSALGIVASWNTHTSAQSGFTGNVSFQLVPNTDMVLDKGDQLHTTKRTVGNGGNIGVGPFTILLEEV